MNPDIYQILCDIFDDLELKGDPIHIETKLADYGFMIVPIEDPTNLRYGVEDE